MTHDDDTGRAAIAIGDSSPKFRAKTALPAKKHMKASCDEAVQQIREIVMLEESEQGDPTGTRPRATHLLLYDKRLADERKLFRLTASDIGGGAY